MTAPYTRPDGPPMPVERTLAIEDIKPYWRNPRRIPQDAIDAVAASIERFGYQQPIVVDTENVIVVGHTRHQALKQLGYTSVPVYVTDLPENKVREYRLVDNRTSEMSDWDHSALVLELREFETALLDRYFPDVDLEIGAITAVNDVTSGDVDEATGKVKRVAEADPTATHTTNVKCPACFHTFEVRTRSLPGLTYDDLWELVEASTGTEAS